MLRDRGSRRPALVPAGCGRIAAALLVFALLGAASRAHGGVLLGDANCDGEVNQADANALFAALFGGPSDCAGLDVNGDGVISAADIVALVRVLPTGPPTATPTRTPPPPTETPLVTATSSASSTATTRTSTATRTATPSATPTTSGTLTTPVNTATATRTANTPTVSGTPTRTVRGTRAATPTETPTASRTATRTRTVTRTRTPTDTPVPTRTRVTRTPTPGTPVATPTATRTVSGSPAATATATPTTTGDPTRTITPTKTATSGSPTRTGTRTRTLTATRTPSLTGTPTRTPTDTRTPTITRTPSITRAPTITATPSNTRTPLFTATASRTATVTRTATITPPPTGTRTATPTRTMTQTRTPTRTLTSTPTRTVTRTPTATIPRPVGPEITAFGIATADNRLRTPIGQTNDGVPIYDWPTQAGFIIYVEGRPGTDNRPLAQCGLMSAPPCAGRAAVQLLASRSLGNGSPAVCDVNPPNIGGVPGVPSLDFGPSQMVTDAINDLACRFDAHLTTDTACTLDELGNFSFVRNRPGDPVKSTLQYCSAPVVGQDITLPSGDTRFKVQLLDVSGTTGNQATLVVRVP